LCPAKQADTTVWTPCAAWLTHWSCGGESTQEISEKQASQLERAETLYFIKYLQISKTSPTPLIKQKTILKFNVDPEIWWIVRLRSTNKTPWVESESTCQNCSLTGPPSQCTWMKSEGFQGSTQTHPGLGTPTPIPSPECTRVEWATRSPWATLPYPAQMDQLLCSHRCLSPPPELLPQCPKLTCIPELLPHTWTLPDHNAQAAARGESKVGPCLVGTSSKHSRNIDQLLRVIGWSKTPDALIGSNLYLEWKTYRVVIGYSFFFSLSPATHSMQQLHCSLLFSYTITSYTLILFTYPLFFYLAIYSFLLLPLLYITSHIYTYICTFNNL
jgi:hypothetical protein